MDITESEILEALMAALSSPGEDAKNVYTVRELARATKRQPITMRRALRVLIDNGTVETCRVQRPRIDGMPGWVPAYRFTEKE